MKPVELYELLRPVKRRLAISLALRYGAVGLSCGLGAAVAWLLAGRFFLLPVYRAGGGLFVFAAILVCGAAFYIRRPTSGSAAAFMDRAGLNDRMTTALRFQTDESVVARLQREDALNYGQRFVDERLRTALPLKPSRKWAAVCGSGAAIAVALLLWPNPMDVIAAQRETERAWVKQQLDMVQEMLELVKEEPVSFPAQKQMEDAMKELERKLADRTAAADALADMERAMKEMQTGMKELEKQRLHSDQWAQEMQRTGTLRALGQALQQSDAEGVKQASEELAERMAQMTPEQKEQLVKELERLAASATAPTPEAGQLLREQLQQLAEKLRMPAWVAAYPKAMATWVLPTPEGPSKTTFSPRSINRRLASSSSCFLGAPTAKL